MAGTGTQGHSGDGGPALSAQLNYPVGVKLDHLGNLFVADGNAVRLVSPTGVMETIAPKQSEVDPGDFGAWDLAVDGAGNVYVTDPWGGAVWLLKRLG